MTGPMAITSRLKRETEEEYAARVAQTPKPIPPTESGTMQVMQKKIVPAECCGKKVE